MAMRSCDCSSVLIPEQRLTKAPFSLYLSRLFLATFPSSSSSSSSSSPRCHLAATSSKPSSSLLQVAPSNLEHLQIPPDSPKPPQPPFPNPQISNELIRTSCHNPQTQALAFHYYQKAVSQPSFQLEPKTLNLVIKTLLRNKQWSSISAISKDFLLLDCFPDHASCAKLIRSCIRARQLKLAESLLDVLETRKSVAAQSYAAAMNGYNKLHMYRSTALLSDRMSSAGVPKNAKCYCLSMEAHRKLGNSDTVLSLFLEFNSEIKNNASTSARIYLALCDSLGRSGRASEALRYFREMAEKGIPSTHSLYASLIRSFAGTREAAIARDLYREAKEKGLARDPDMFLRLVLMHVELGSLEETVEIAEEMVRIKIKVTDCIFSTIVNGFTKKRGLLASLKAYEKLRSLGCQPGQVTYASIINIYCRLSLCPEAENVFAEMLERGFDKCVVAYSNIISMYGKNGRDRDAMKLLGKMKEKGCGPNVWVYNSLLDMHGRLPDLRRVGELWKEMKRRGVEPDRVSYTSVICAHSKARQFEECLKFFDQYKKNGGKADEAMAGVMVGVYSKSNRVDDLVRLLKDLKVDGRELDGRLYKSALYAFRDSGLRVYAEWLEENFGFRTKNT